MFRVFVNDPKMTLQIIMDRILLCRNFSLSKFELGGGKAQFAEKIVGVRSQHIDANYVGKPYKPNLT